MRRFKAMGRGGDDGNLEGTCSLKREAITRLL